VTGLRPAQGTVEGRSSARKNASAYIVTTIAPFRNLSARRSIRVCDFCPSERGPEL